MVDHLMNKKFALTSKTNNQSGFTLIELLVSITILVLMTGMGIAALLNQSERQGVLQSARSAQQFLKIARSKAQAKQAPAECNPVAGSAATAANFLEAVEVRSNTPTTLSLIAICTINDTPNQSVSYPNGELRFTEGVTVSLFPTVRFNTLSGGTDLGSDELVMLEGRNMDFSFNIGATGRIDEGGFCTIVSPTTCTPL